MVRKHLVAAAVLLLVTAVYFWPLLLRVREAIPGGPTDRDVATFVWNVGWVRHALESEAGLLHTDRVLLPFDDRPVRPGRL